MIQVVNAEDLTSSVSPYQGDTHLSLTNCLGRADGMDRGPQAFVVDVDGRCEVKAHYHAIDQFQLFVRGEAIGKQPICEPATVFYTDGYTPYGPLVGHDNGLKFFNLRARADLGAHHMPEARKDMLRRPGRMVVAYVPSAEPSAFIGVQTTAIIGPEEDGLLTLATVAGPNEALEDDVAGGAGRYEFVLSGSIELDSRQYGSGSLIFAAAGMRLPERRATAEGAHVVTLQAPAE